MIALWIGNELLILHCLNISQNKTQSTRHSLTVTVKIQIIKEERDYDARHRQLCLYESHGVEEQWLLIEFVSERA